MLRQGSKGGGRWWGDEAAALAAGGLTRAGSGLGGFPVGRGAWDRDRNAAYIFRGREAASDLAGHPVDGEAVGGEGLVAGIGDELTVPSGGGDDAAKDFVGLLIEDREFNVCPE